MMYCKSKSVILYNIIINKNFMDILRRYLTYKMSLSIVDHPPYAFIVEFPVSNSLKQILTFLVHTHKHIPFILTKETFSIVKSNGNTTFVFDGQIYAHNLLMYYVNPELLDSPEPDKIEPNYFIHVPTSSLVQCIKKSTKKDSIRLSQLMTDRRKMIVEFGDSIRKKSEIIIDSSREYPCIYNDPTGLPTSRPNITVRLNSFQFPSTGNGRGLDIRSTIVVYPHGIRIESSGIAGVSNITEGITDGASVCSVSVRSDILKALSKLACLCDEGIVRVYCNNSDLIRLEIPISVIGVAYIYLKNDKSDD